MPVALTLPRPARLLIAAVCLLLWLAGVPAAGAAPEGALTIAMHFSPVTRWLDPAEGESTITSRSPFPGSYMSPYEDLKLRR